jgi:predicted helicase
MSFSSIIEKYRKEAFSERDKGDKFERLIQAYLLSDPTYSHTIKKVWLWNEFFAREQFGRGDVGIDLVALTHSGEYWSIQCKCYKEDSSIDKASVDSFLTTSGRSFKDDAGQSIHFSQCLWVSTTNRWSTNASEALANQQIPVTRINLSDLQQAPVEWEKLEQGIHGEEARTSKKSLRAHQLEALEKAHEHFKQHDRGQLIMACGTGKTFTSLRIAENETKGKGLVLFLVPSIALLGQSLREWTADANEAINPICICSDPKVTRKRTFDNDSEQFSTVDLAFPASTDMNHIVRQFETARASKGMTVVFSTYQSIQVVSDAQKELSTLGLGEFDLIICDEAHRTTGVTLSDEDESAFTRVHNNDFLKAKKRLYMTATPRLFSDDAKTKADLADAVLCSMDDKHLYGEEIYRIGFGEAVDKDLLTDYKVLILTLNESDVPPALQKLVANEDSEINSDDASKLIGCINALSKQIIGDEGLIKTSDPAPMRRAVAFCPRITDSKRISSMFNTSSTIYKDALPENSAEVMITAEARHIDGAMRAPERDELLSWLKDDVNEGECKILTNVRCLSEGVDVPSLDAVLFLSARNSQVDVVQSVGRVMRKSAGKKYGYIIIPVVVPSFVEPDKALDDNARFKVVWTVLNALRAHDDRFNATINKIELNKKRPQQIIGGAVQYTFNNGDAVARDKDSAYSPNAEMSRQLAMQFEELQNVVFARMVKKVGDRRYWEQWAQNVAEIAQRQTDRITRLIKEDTKHQRAFDSFLKGLHKNINPSITENEAVEMLSQHIITKPVFDALFENYSFVQNNPMSQSMQKMLDLLEEQSFQKDAETLEKFYESVKKRAAGIDNAEGKQRIIIELYDKFFKTAFPKMVEKLGIVYTPVEVVDFIIHSVNDILNKEFGRSISDENIHVLDPFTGTGTFITRLIQSGLINDHDLERKYKHELHANEIVLLAYYIAAINIENAYHDQTPDPDDGIGKSKYSPFDGIVLTDTFQLGESEDGEKLFSEMFPQNSKRVQRQQKAPLRVIIGNPPYSIGQKSANDNAQNQSYPRLDQRIAQTYAKQSSAGLNKSLYDAYIKAFRWSTDRLDKSGGIICFVSNGAWLDGNSTDGFRKSIEKEFTSIYIFNLRGNARTSGELRQKEAGNVFGSGSRTPIAITLLVKNPEGKTEKATIQYHDIGDYLVREEKLKIVRNFNSFANVELPLKKLTPNEHGDWLSMRNSAFDKFIPVAPEKTFDTKSKSFFIAQSLGALTGRDSWVINFSKTYLIENINKTINHFNEQRTQLSARKIIEPQIDSTKGSWSQIWLDLVKKNYILKEEIEEYRICQFRPFVKEHSYFGKDLNARRYQLPKLFPSIEYSNLVIVTTGVSAGKPFCVSIVKDIPNYDFIEKSNCFPLFFYEENKASQKVLFDNDESQKYVRRDAISDFILERAKQQYSKTLSKEDIFYYVYGFLHTNEYRETFANDLKKMLPRLPLVENEADFWAFSKAGRQLADLHLNYETVAPHPDVIVSGDDGHFYKVEKMRFPKKGEKSSILYNSQIIVSNIPEKAYSYVVNGKSAIEWIMERYQISTHKESGITNDPNDWADEVGNPRYILDLLLSIINVSVQTVDIVDNLPKMNFE